MSRAELDVFRLKGADAGLFCLLHRPATPMAVRGAVLYLHPFADEMNKSRRMAAMQARAFAGQGWLVLQFDFHGCGDSDGEFGGASWSGWLEDARVAARWLEAKSGYQPVLWGLRAGCLVASALAGETAGTHLLYWNPVLSGKQHLQQFLRMQIAGAMLGDGTGAREGTRQLRERLAGGQFLEIAGYRLAPGLALGLEAASLDRPPLNSRVGWFEVSGATPPAMPPGSLLRQEAWREQGVRVDTTMVGGAAFWQTQEIEDVPPLVQASSQWLEGVCK